MTLYTIGYEGRSLPQFLADLGTHAVRLRALSQARTTALPCYEADFI